MKYLLIILLLAVPVSAQQITKYSYQRSMVIQTLDKQGNVTSEITRSSRVVFSDGLNPIELSVVEAGRLSKRIDWKHFRDPQITDLNGTPLNLNAPKNGSLWKDGFRSVRWSAEGDVYLPMEAKFETDKMRFTIVYTDWKLFRVSLKITELGEAQ